MFRSGSGSATCWRRTSRQTWYAISPSFGVVVPVRRCGGDRRTGRDPSLASLARDPEVPRGCPGRGRPDRRAAIAAGSDTGAWTADCDRCDCRKNVEIGVRSVGRRKRRTLGTTILVGAREWPTCSHWSRSACRSTNTTPRRIRCHGIRHRGWAPTPVRAGRDRWTRGRTASSVAYPRRRNSPTVRSVDRQGCRQTPVDFMGVLSRRHGPARRRSGPVRSA